MTPPQKPVHLFGFDARDLVSQYDPPPALATGNNFTTYGYNLNKQLTNVTRPDGLQIGYTYDPQIGWLTNVSLPLGERIGYVYANQSCGCSGAGRVSDVRFNAVDYASAIHYDYDGSLVTGVTWSGPVAGIVNAGYDNFFRVNALAVNGSAFVSFGYDDDGLLTQAGLLTLSRDLQNGRLTGTTLNTVNDSWTYTGFGEAQTYTASAGATALYAMDFARDNAGRITNKLEVTGGVVSSYDYTYDPDRGWLTAVASNGVAVAHYAYDDNGNRLTHTTPTDTVTGVYDDQDRLLSLSTITPQLSTDFTYTANGELQTKTTGSATVTYSYDVRGSLRDVTLANGTVVSYVIDATGRRIGRKVNGVFTQQWLYQDSLKPIAELNAAGAVVSRFIYAGKANVPEYMVRGGITYRLITDHLGSVRLVVNAANGAIAQRMDYDEFGRVLADTNPGFQPFGYAGGLYDPLTGLVRFGARDYDAESGRWTSKDQIGFNGGNNWYAYVADDPMNAIDPSGLVWKPPGSVTHGRPTSGLSLPDVIGSDELGLGLAGPGILADAHEMLTESPITGALGKSLSYLGLANSGLAVLKHPCPKEILSFLGDVASMANLYVGYFKTSLDFADWISDKATPGIKESQNPLPGQQRTRGRNYYGEGKL